MSDSNFYKTRVDAHQHFWAIERGDYDWLSPKLVALYQNFLPNDLLLLLKSNNVSKTVLIQAAETNEETNFLLGIAERTDFVAGVVGWINMSSTNSLMRLQELSDNHYFKGIRPMIQDIADDNWMLKPELTPVYEALIEKDLCFDALVKPQHLEALHTLLQRHPKLKVVIDHGAKPNIANNSFKEWGTLISQLAKSTSAYCKLSGLTTEAGENADSETLIPYIDHLVSNFGPDRIMWGSDWPVVNMSSSYDNWLRVCDRYLSTLEQSAQTAIWSKTAETFYRLKDPIQPQNNSIGSAQ